MNQVISTLNISARKKKKSNKIYQM